MTTKISIVTMNRLDILERVLVALQRTCKGEDIEVLITDNGSADSTVGFLRSWHCQGRFPSMHVWSLPRNIGSARARNVHWEHCIGYPTVKMDDKVEWLAPGWLRALEHISTTGHTLLGPAYDPTVQPLERLSPCLPWIQWDSDGGIGGPYLYLPAEVTSALGMWDELPGVIYGWEDVLYIQRARLMGWHYGISLRSPFNSLAHASPFAREESMKAHPLYEQRLLEYREAERDVFIAPHTQQNPDDPSWGGVEVTTGTKEEQEA